MIGIQNTKNLTGVSVTGDVHDFQELYDALHSIVGEESEYPKYDDVRLRVLGVCYDIRHAIMGNREALHVPNGLDRERMRYLSITGSEMNIYLKFEVLMPEMLFVSYVLNDFIFLHEKKHKTHSWDQTIAVVRKFQATFTTCLQDTLTEKKFAQLKKYITPQNIWNTSLYRGYATQYVDTLNIKYIHMDREKREKNISIIAKRLGTLDQQYIKVFNEIHVVAQQNGVHPSDIRPVEPYPDEFDW